MCVCACTHTFTHTQIFVNVQQGVSSVSETKHPRVCCSMLQCVAEYLLQCVAEYLLQCVAEYLL